MSGHLAVRCVNHARRWAVSVAPGHVSADAALARPTLGWCHECLCRHVGWLPIHDVDGRKAGRKSQNAPRSAETGARTVLQTGD